MSLLFLRYSEPSVGTQTVALCFRDQQTEGYPHCLCMLVQVFACAQVTESFI